MVADRIKGMVNTNTLKGLLDARNHGIIAISIVNDCIAFATVYKTLDKLLTSASDGDDWVDV